jgi:regulator of sigma E protease
MLTAIAIIFTFGIVVFFHEFGHFLAAKRTGVKVEKFSLGFGPEIIGFTKGDTRYLLSLVPLGGYLKMAGENPEEEREGKPDEFLSQPWYKKIFIVFCGPLMNFVLAILLFSLVIFVWGQPVVKTDEARIGEVTIDSPADKAGLKSGDNIVSIDGTTVVTWEDMSKIIHYKANQSVELAILRNGQELKVKVIPKYDKDRKVGLIGIVAPFEMKRMNIFNSLIKGVEQTYDWSVLTLKFLGLMIIGKVKADVSGPVGIGQLISQVARTGISNLFYLIAIISVNLGLFNLFPIPILDGGHIMFFTYEGLSGKALDAKKVQVAQVMGMSILIAIMIFATYKDFLRIFGKG